CALPIYHGLLTIDGRKMSKSLGNFYTIQDVLKRFEADVLKLFFLSAHYRSAMDFTFEGLDNTKKAYEKIERFLAELARTERREAGASGQLVGEAGALREKFEKAMDDDFNTAVASSVLFELLNLGYIYLAQKKNMDAALFVGRELVELGSVLGLHFKASQKIRPMSRGYVVEFDGNIRLDERTETEVEKLVQERDEARKKKNFKKADEIRDQLRKLGVTVKDKERSA
ncbi:MAG: class I tRNA ligase family protein, partial [Candidatus Omnitrophica bacterium]|nr:class I tRNA ligase family protein [Candidatus Omnitrophota bacterium]